MSQPRILVVDDTPHNVKLLEDLLSVNHFDVVSAGSGAEALEKLSSDKPDLVLLDVVMPEMSGYEVCRRIRANAATRLLPVVMVTALDPDEERVKGIEAGADDFLAKPVNTLELLARVRSLLRIRELHQRVEKQSEALGVLAATLEQRVKEQVEEISRLERLKRFFSPQIADAIAGDGGALLEPHRRHVTVVFCDLRRFTAFAESAEPEEMIELLRGFHAEMGKLIVTFEGTLERFTGDGMMVFFNDPVEVTDPEVRAVTMAVGMQAAVSALRGEWERLGFDLDLGIGITSGYATLGTIGFEGRFDYAALGTVTNQAARLCGEAAPGQILVSERLLGAVEDIVEAEFAGELALKGFRAPVRAHVIAGLRPRD